MQPKDTNHYLSWIDVDNELHCEQLSPAKKVITIGRSDQADVEVFNTSVSRQHLELSWNQGKLQVKDTGSSFGTWVNGDQLAPHVAESLVVDTEIKLGNLSMWYELRRSDESQELFQTCFHPPDVADETELSGEINDFRIKLLGMLQDNYGDDTLNVQLIKNIDSELHDLISAQELRLKEQRILNSISHILNRSLSSSELLKTSLNLVSKVLNADRGFVVLKDCQAEGFEFLAMRHFNALRWSDEPSKQTFSQKLVARCFEQNQIIIIGDSQLNETLSDLNPVSDGGGRSIVVIPLVQDTQVVGVMYLDNQNKSHNFSQTQIPFLTTFAAHTSIALHNTLLYKRAITDDLTQLYTRQHIDESLSEAIKQADNSGQQLALLVMDLDHFKNINDNYGHITGDEVLKTFADIIRKHINDDAHAGRFGGEEFIVILPDVEPQQALQLAEAIRQDLAATTITQDEHSVKVTVSIGIANYHDKYGSNNLLFLDDADNAMYQAKNDGRNRTVVAP
ncbi:diguanylate cyclase [Marinicella sp. S1101]|uniref:diguanylate cyclase n=1 Tax=Marinicella marina TaxID=2996016 RepID=UPI0022609E0E|nr:diguanylate cyclase [Marinicella marina]MCX7553393.1 diguanylate cyclase [Marinicella marina]MDJ1140016.1 diguanylate cyclase [Marinicella marina]